MLKTIRHGESGSIVTAAKLLMGVLCIGEKVEDPESYIKVNSAYDAVFVASVCAWQGRHNLTSDGVIGPKTWTAIAAEAPTCSTSKNRISGQTLALQILLDSQVVCDGIYGKKTKYAVAAFQYAKGLKADGICGEKTWAAIICGSETAARDDDTTDSNTVVYKSTVNYKQHDKRWGSNNYTSCGNKKQTMSNSGCGPTAMANIIATLVDKSVTPWDLALLAMKWGDRTASSGTATSFFKHIQSYYKFKKMVGTGSLEVLKSCLDAGGYVVCRMGPGYWTNGGHYITAWKYDSDYIYCNDPSSPTSKRSERTKQKLSDFVKQRKDFWCFWPEREESPFEPVDDVKSRAIIDISKHDGDINFEALAPWVSLIIARVSLGSDIDVRIMEYIPDMIANEIPYGVYCYSYARDAAKGKDEAEKMLQYTEGFEPLFCVLDIEETCVTQDGIKAWTKVMREKGVRIGCYVAHHLYKTYGFDDLRDLFDFIWIPRYGANDGVLEHSTMPGYICDLWQYTSHGSMPGMTSKVDVNVITGMGKSLSWFLGGDI